MAGAYLAEDARDRAVRGADDGAHVDGARVLERPVEALEQVRPVADNGALERDARGAKQATSWLLAIECATRSHFICKERCS